MNKIIHKAKIQNSGKFMKCNGDEHPRQNARITQYF